MTDRDKRKLSVPEMPASGPAAYERILERFYASIDHAEQYSWQLLEEKIREAAEVELTAEEMTREELSLLQAYLKRDLADLGYFVHQTGEGVAAWLNFDLNILELKFGQMLSALADQTRLDHAYLEQRLAHGADEYMTGEVATVGTLRCLNCGTLVQLEQTALIEACHECGAEYFHRDSHKSH